MAVSVIFFVTLLEKSYSVPFKNQPLNVYPLFFGLLGFVANFPSSTVCFATLDPPSELNVTVYFVTVCSSLVVELFVLDFIFSHFATIVISFSKGLVKSTFSSPIYHPINL